MSSPDPFVRCVLRDEGDVVQRIGEGVVRGPVEGRWMVHTPGDGGDPVGFDTAEEANAWLEDWARKAEFAALKERLIALEHLVANLTTEWAIRSRRGGRAWQRTSDRSLAVAVLKQLRSERRRGLELVHRQVGEWEVDADD